MTEARLTALRQEARSNDKKVRDDARRILEAEGYTAEKMCWHCDKRPEQFQGTGLCETCHRELKFREAVEKFLPKAKDTIEALSRLVNTGGAGIEALKQALAREHRTNQQLVCRAVVALLEKWNEDAKHGPGHFDARNEASVKFAEAVFQNVPERLRYFPYL